MKQVLDALCRAEAVVFATPIYFYNMAGQMKVFLDRTYPLRRNAHFRKAALLAASCEGDESVFDTAVSGFEEYLRCFPDVENAGSVLAGGVCASCALPEKAVEDARMLGREI